MRTTGCGGACECSPVCKKAWAVLILDCNSLQADKDHGQSVVQAVAFVTTLDRL